MIHLEYVPRPSKPKNMYDLFDLESGSRGSISEQKVTELNNGNAAEIATVRLAWGPGSPDADLWVFIRRPQDLHTALDYLIRNIDSTVRGLSLIQPNGRFSRSIFAYVEGHASSADHEFVTQLQNQYSVSIAIRAKEYFEARKDDEIRPATKTKQVFLFNPPAN